MASVPRSYFCTCTHSSSSVRSLTSRTRTQTVGSIYGTPFLQSRSIAAGAAATARVQVQRRPLYHRYESESAVNRG